MEGPCGHSFIQVCAGCLVLYIHVGALVGVCTTNMCRPPHRTRRLVRSPRKPELHGFAPGGSTVDALNADAVLSLPITTQETVS